MLQTMTFLATEADAWFLRNRDKMATREAIKNDLLLKLIQDKGLRPKCVLEVGCANGWRLEELRKRYGCICTGIEPSTLAQRDAADRYPDIDVRAGMAHHLNFTDGSFDLIIYGFCLYLADPTRLFEIAAEGDRVLKESSHIALLDFHSPEPCSVVYKHAPHLRSYKMTYSSLWLWHPGYDLISASISADKQLETALLQKNMKAAFQLKEQA